MIKLHAIPSILLLLIVLLLAGCEDSIQDEIENGERSTFGIRADRILSNYEEAATRTGGVPFETVVSLNYTIGNDEFVASGVLIAPGWILTAGHNFYVAEEQREPVRAEDIDVAFGANPNAPTQTTGVQRIVFHPTWEKNNDFLLYGNDLCLLELTNPMTTVTPAEYYTESAEPVGAEIWFAGFGDYSEVLGGNPDELSLKHAVQNTLDRSMGGLTSTSGGVTYTGGLLAFDFDSPAGMNNTLGDSEVGDEEVILGPGTSQADALDLEGTTVTGDSGGPLFIAINGEWQVAGVLSGGVEAPVSGHRDGDYGDISVFTRVSPHADWVSNVIQ